MVVIITLDYQSEWQCFPKKNVENRSSIICINYYLLHQIHHYYQIRIRDAPVAPQLV
jgi:hypothetical protein